MDRTSHGSRSVDDAKISNFLRRIFVKFETNTAPLKKAIA